MVAKYGLLFAIILVGGLAFPVEDDVSMFFDHSLEDVGGVEGRVVGGSVAAEGSWPWMVGLSSGLLTRSFLCGGSLVTNRHILTAAHCIAAVFSGGSLAGTLRAHVGTNRWNSGGQTLAIQRNVTHPNYVAATIKNDLGFLVAAANVALNQRVRIIAVNYDWVGGNVPARVAGWGRIRQGGSLSNTLLELRKNTFDGNRCVQDVARLAAQFNIRAPAVEPHIELCTFHSVNHGTCHGDSGGPLVRNSNNQQIGVVSWGLPCARGAPDMFVRVSAYRAWMQNAMR